MKDKDKAFEFEIGDKVRVTGIIKIEYHETKRLVGYHEMKRLVGVEECEPFTAVVTGYTFRYSGTVIPGRPLPTMTIDYEPGYLDAKSAVKVALVKKNMRHKEIAVPLSHIVKLIKQQQ